MINLHSHYFHCLVSQRGLRSLGTLGTKVLSAAKQDKPKPNTTLLKKITDVMQIMVAVLDE